LWMRFVVVVVIIRQCYRAFASALFETF
jgi:hypothetical protein